MQFECWEMTEMPTYFDISKIKSAYQSYTPVFSQMSHRTSTSCWSQMQSIQHLKLMSYIQALHVSINTISKPSPPNRYFLDSIQDVLPDCAAMMYTSPDGKVHGANMGASWVLSAPGGPHVGLMNPAIWVGCLNNSPPVRDQSTSVKYDIMF